MTATEAQVREAVAAAQDALVNLAVFALAYRLGRQDLQLLLRWPSPMERARRDLQVKLLMVAKLLAGLEAIDWSWLSLNDRTAYIELAADLIRDSPTSRSLTPKTTSARANTEPLEWKTPGGIRVARASARRVRSSSLKEVRALSADTTPRSGRVAERRVAGDTGSTSKSMWSA